MNRALRTAAEAASPVVSWALERVRARRGAVILAYHEISARALLAGQYLYVSLSELVSRLAAKQSTAGLAAITFDDGYGPPSRSRQSSRPRSIGAAAPGLARRRFRSATTLLRGRCGADADLALLPRVPLYERDSTPIVALKVATAR